MLRLRFLATLSVALLLFAGVSRAQCAPNAFNFTNNLCGGPAQFTINPNVACKPFNLPAGCGGDWLCVAVAPAVSSAPFPDRDIAIGNVSSILPGGACDFLVANGHLGPIAPTSGQVTLFTNSGMSRTRLANTLTMSPLPNNGGWTSGSHSFAAFSVARLFQFEVVCPGNYTVQLNQVGGPSISALKWRLFSPGTDSSWRPRNSNILMGSGATGVSPTVPLGPGWHALVVFKNGAPVTTNYQYVLTVTTQPNPVPAISSTSGLVACGGPMTLTLSGSDFIPPCTTVAVNGSPVAATVGPTSITIPLPGFASPGNLTVSVTNPSPGGGTATVNVPIAPAATPVITGCNPSSVPYGGGPLGITLQGANFTPTSTVNLNGIPKATTFVSPAALAITLTAADLLATGPLIFQVVDPCSVTPSPVFTCPIACPTPTVASLSPSVVVENCSSFTLTVNGSGFCPTSTVTFNGATFQPMTSTPTSLSVPIPQSAVPTATSFNVTVTNPAPGGGMSNGVPFTVRLPYPGTQEDFVLASGVNGPATTGPGLTIKTAPAGSTLLFDVATPMGTVVNRPFFVVADLASTNAINPPCIGPAPQLVWVGSSSFPTFVLVGPPPGTLVSLSPVLQAGGNQFAFTTPLGLAGNSILVQAIVLSPLGAVIPNVMLSDAHEIRF